MLRMTTASPRWSPSTSAGSTRESTQPITRRAGLVGKGRPWNAPAAANASFRWMSSVCRWSYLSLLRTARRLGCQCSSCPASPQTESPSRRRVRSDRHPRCTTSAGLSIFFRWPVKWSAKRPRCRHRGPWRRLRLASPAARPSPALDGLHGRAFCHSTLTSPLLVSAGLVWTRSLYTAVATAKPTMAHMARTIIECRLPWPSKYTTSRREVTAAPGGRA
jgi:hypothetical protein